MVYNCMKALPQCTIELLNAQVSDTRDVDGSNLPATYSFNLF